MGLFSFLKRSKKNVENIENNEICEVTEVNQELENQIIKTPYEQLEELIIANPGINTKKGEVCFYSGYAEAGKKKTVTTGYSGGSSGVSIRIAKGVSYHTGGSSKKAIRKTIIERYDGQLYITNQRIILLSEKYGFTATIPSIIQIEPIEEGFIVHQSSKSHLVITDDRENIINIFNLMGSAYDEQQ